MSYHLLCKEYDNCFTVFGFEMLTNETIKYTIQYVDLFLFRWHDLAFFFLSV